MGDGNTGVAVCACGTGVTAFDDTSGLGGGEKCKVPKGSTYTPENHNKNRLLGPYSTMVVYVEPLGYTEPSQQSLPISVYLELTDTVPKAGSWFRKHRGLHEARVSVSY